MFLFLVPLNSQEDGKRRKFIIMACALSFIHYIHLINKTATKGIEFCYKYLYSYPPFNIEVLSINL